VTDEPEEKTVTITPPQVAPNETQVWWQWTQQHLAAQKSQIENDIAAQFNMYDEAVGAALGEKCCDLREHFERELNFVKREMEQAQTQISTHAELEREREALRARAIEADRTDREALRRDITALRDQIGVERGLRTLHDGSRLPVPKFQSSRRSYRSCRLRPRSRGSMRIRRLRRSSAS
jgi:transposase